MPSSPRRLRSALLATALLLLAGGAQAQKGPAIPEMKPGRYGYVMEMTNPGMPMKMPPTAFEQCVTAKDVAEGKAFQAQKDAGMDCSYRDVKTSPGSFSFKSSCTMKDGMSSQGDFAGTIAGNVTTINIQQKLSGGQIPDSMRNSSIRIVMTRKGEC